MIDIDYNEVSSIGFSYTTLKITEDLNCKVKYTDGSEKIIKVKDLLAEVINLLGNEYPEIIKLSDVMYFMMLSYLSVFIYSIYDATFIGSSFLLSNDYILRSFDIYEYKIPTMIVNKYYNLTVNSHGIYLQEDHSEPITTISFNEGDIMLRYSIKPNEELVFVFNRVYSDMYMTPFGVFSPGLYILKL